MKNNNSHIVIIDFEFTGLDNTFIKDNEIIQMKVANMASRQRASRNYGTTKMITAHPYIHHGRYKYYGKKFSKSEFENLLKFIEIDPSDSNVIYYGFGVTQDMLMLKKYSININIIDIREMLQLSKYGYRMATEGSGLECAYNIVTCKIPDLKNHDGLDEMNIISELYQETMRVRKKKYMTVMPHGHCAGMPLKQYVENYRRAADGYRLNNDDVLADSMTALISEREEDDNDDIQYYG